MGMQKKRMRLGILVAALAFILWQLRARGAWDAALWRLAVAEGDGLLLGLMALLMPVNLGLEVLKWGQTSGRPFPLATRDVLAGTAAGFLSPNRVGDGLARVARLPAALRERGVRASVSGSVAQGVITLGVGGLAATAPALRWPVLTAALAILVTYLFWTPDARNIRQRLPVRLQNWVDGRLGIGDPAEASLPLRLRLALLLWSALRYCVFTAQYLIALLAFEVEAGWQDVAMVWLVNAAVPTGALAEFGVREASALAVLQPAGLEAPRVVLATLAVWGVNLLLPGGIGLGQIRFRHVS